MIIHVRIGSQGPAVVMLHGFADIARLDSFVARALLVAEFVNSIDLKQTITPGPERFMIVPEAKRSARSGGELTLRAIVKCGVPAKRASMTLIETRGHQLFPVLDAAQIDTAKRFASGIRTGGGRLRRGRA